MDENIGIKNDLKKAPRTGDWGVMCPEVNKDKCTGCASCVPFCPEATIEMVSRNDKSKFKKMSKIDYEYCKGCGVCATVCPVKAITMKKK